MEPPQPNPPPKKKKMFWLYLLQISKAAPYHLDSTLRIGGVEAQRDLEELSTSLAPRTQAELKKKLYIYIYISMH